MQRVTKDKLPGYTGAGAYEGALRFWNEQDSLLTPKWSPSYGNLFPRELDFFAFDAFGVLYGLDKTMQVSIFWAETGEVEPLRINEDEFYGIIASDPEGTISLSFYQEVVSALGQLEHTQNFAFKVETALGGPLEVNNVYICDRVQHLVSLGKIARQIKDLKVGTKLNIRSEDV